MYNWKDTRNYRRFRDESGNVIANIIYVDGEEVAPFQMKCMKPTQAWIAGSGIWKNGITTPNRCPWMRSWKKDTPKRHSAAQRIWRA